MYASSNTHTISSPKLPILANVSMPSWWDVMRVPGPERWRWWASGPKGTLSGTALSKAVARSRAARAMGELR